jgi:hypothetical protein
MTADLSITFDEPVVRGAFDLAVRLMHGARISASPDLSYQAGTGADAEVPQCLKRSITWPKRTVRRRVAQSR